MDIAPEYWLPEEVPDFPDFIDESPTEFLRPKIEFRLLFRSEELFFLRPGTGMLRAVFGRTMTGSSSPSSSGIVGGRFGFRPPLPGAAADLPKNERRLPPPLRILASARARALGSSSRSSPTADIFHSFAISSSTLPQSGRW